MTAGTPGRVAGAIHQCSGVVVTRTSSVRDAESTAKAPFLMEAIGAQGAENYHRVVNFMRPRAAAVIGESAWHLSIIGGAPSAQGHGIGRRLIESTLAEADEAVVKCYLELLTAGTLASTCGSDFPPLDPL